MKARKYATANVDVPRKGNVDRKTYPRDIVIQTGGTFPARGTWIERMVGIILDRENVRRSPQGERG